MTISLDDCRIDWYRYGVGGKSLLRVTHMPSGTAVNRPGVGLQDDWKLDDALAELDRRLQPDTAK